MIQRTLQRSILLVPLALVLGGSALAQSPTKDPRRAAARGSTPVPGPVESQATGVLAQDLTWYRHENRPPFVDELVEGEDTADVLYAGNAVFTTQGAPEVPGALRKPLFRDGRFDPGYFIVHFERPITALDRDLLDLSTGAPLRADGSRVARWYVPNNAQVVWVDDFATYSLLSELEQVDWMGRYEPAYKLDPTIGTTPLSSPERVSRAMYQLNVDLVPGHPAQLVRRAVRAAGGNVLETIELRGKRGYDVRFLVVEIRPQLIESLAQIEGIRMIQERGDGLAKYDLSGGGKLQSRTLTADDGSASPIVTSSNYPLWLVHDLQGQGQLIGVVDSNLGWNNTGTSGCGFGYPDTAIDNWGFALPNLSRVLLGSVGAGGVNLKIPRSDELGGAQLGSSITNEHGAGVAGAAAGDFYGNNDTKWWEHDVDNWESWAPTNYSGLLGPGIAHEAQLYFTPVDNAAGAFRWEFIGEFEANMTTTLTNMANAGVCSTNHSVGLAEASNTYTQTSVVHDTIGYDHPDMLQCMAAGNDGAGTNRLTSQAVVKNGMAVGASDDVLQPENRVTFSSTGPRFDGAIKPDVMAPGNDEAPRAGGVQSLLILPDSNGLGSASCEYQYTAGTSFASPIIAGAAALVHQYFEEGRYPGTESILDPSSALMKAMLINSGHRLTGANLGDGTYPNMYQGWGEPVLTDVLDLGGARDLIATDVSSAQGFTSAGSANDVITFTVDGSAERLRVTLVWTDEPGGTGTGKKLINDLDLRVTAPGGPTYLGNVFNGSAGVSQTGGSADTLNNVENVIVASPATGTWTATIDPGAGNYASGQGYALVITGDVSEGGGGGPGAPVAEFSGSPTSGIAPLNVSFTDLSTGSISTYSWDFGDLGSSNAANPNHTYTSPGTYTVALSVTGPGGNDTETKTSYITVDPPPTGGGLYFLSFDSGTSVPGVGNVADEDIVTYDPSTGTWAWYADLSDVGVTQDVNALHVLSTGELVLSFQGPVSVPGLIGGPSGTSVDDSDLVIFTPTQTGSNTSGTFTFVFDGSDVGLSTNGEDIDGVYEFPGGGLAISTTGSANVNGLSGGRDEDVLFFSATQYGSVTSGSFSMYFDGSDVGMSDSSSDDLNAVTFDGGIDLLFSTLGNYSGAGSSGNDEDISRFSGTFGSATSGSASIELDLSALGISTAEDVDGLCFVQ